MAEAAEIEFLTTPPPRLEAAIQTGRTPVVPWQTPHWAAVLSALGQGRSEWLVARRGGRDLAALLCCRMAVIRGRFLGRAGEGLLERAALSLLPMVEAAGGPVVLDPQATADDLAGLVLAAADRAEQTKALRFRGSLPLGLAEDKAAEAAGQLERAGLTLGKWGTFVVSLEPEEEAIMASFSATTRKKVRRAGRQGLTVRPLGQGDKDQFYRLLAESRQRLGLVGGHWDLLKLDRIEAATPDTVRLFGAFDQNDELLATAGVIVAGATATSISLFQGDRAEAANLPAVYALHWAIITWAKSVGARWYDLNGVDPDPPPKSKAAGIRYFKERWGGEYLEWPTFVREFRRPIKRLINLAR